MVGGWGIYSPNHQTSRLGGGWRQPRHPAVRVPTVGALTLGPPGCPVAHRTCTVVSGAPAWACLTSARAGAHLMRPQVAVGDEVAVAPLSHRTVGCTPDMSGEL
jgi:hypothetical protein